MPTMRRAALVGLVTLLVAATARAQTAPPPAPSPPPPSTTPAESPAAPPPAAPPAPVAPLPSTLAPEPSSGPPLQLTERSPMDAQQQAPRPEPFYRTSWFWAVVGVAFATAFIITFVELRDKSNQPPDTTFGNMHAF